MSRWEPGTQIHWIYRGKRHGIDYVRPMTVVRDDEAGLVAWLAPGTQLIRPVLPDGRNIRDLGIDDGRWHHRRVAKLDVWQGGGTLKVAPAGRPWSVWHFWNPDGSFKCWYVNLENVHERDVPGRTTRTEDCVLDLVVTPDRDVRRKDDDELEAAQRNGIYDARRVAEIESYAEDAAKVIAAWESPFSDNWPNWLPDPTWPLPPAPVIE